MTGWVTEEAEVLLRSAGYSTLLLVDPPSLAFEDEEVFGFVCVFDSPQMLIDSCPKAEGSLLSKHCPRSLSTHSDRFKRIGKFRAGM